MGLRPGLVMGGDVEVGWCEEYGFHGVDYNWEYPNSAGDWQGLGALLAETRARFGQQFFISVDYYPDGRQEPILAKLRAAQHADLLHMMSYDQPGKHSTWEFGKQSVDQGVGILPASSLTMGLPFYARNVKTGQWTTYEDLARDGKLADRPDLDQVGNDYFNGVDMIRRKTEYALSLGLGGVMIWEVGQDHFSNPDRSLAPDALLIAISSARAGHGGAAGKDEL